MIVIKQEEKNVTDEGERVRIRERERQREKSGE